MGWLGISVDFLWGFVWWVMGVCGVCGGGVRCVGFVRLKWIAT